MTPTELYYPRRKDLSSHMIFFTDIEDWHYFFNKEYPVRSYSAKDVGYSVKPEDAALAFICVTSFAFLSFFTTVIVNRFSDISQYFTHIFIAVVALSTIIAIGSCVFSRISGYKRSRFTVAALDNPDEETKALHPHDIYVKIMELEIEEDNSLWNDFSEYVKVYHDMVEEPVENTKTHEAFVDILNKKRVNILLEVLEVSESKDEFVRGYDEIKADEVRALYA